VDFVPAPLVETPADAPSPEWRPLSPSAAAVRTIAGAIGGIILSIPAAALLVSALVGQLGFGPLTGGIVAILGSTLAGAAIGAWLGRLRWKRTRWRLDDVGLRVKRGLLWYTEVLVPRSRVQHLDIERGPLERQFTLATLVVHTAGTQTHALRLSGLDELDAVALRDALIPDAARDVDAL
jgi:membrane protein YdbS with pleckstrin-like domain